MNPTKDCNELVSKVSAIASVPSVGACEIKASREAPNEALAQWRRLSADVRGSAGSVTTLRHPHSLSPSPPLVVPAAGVLGGWLGLGSSVPWVAVGFRKIFC